MVEGYFDRLPCEILHNIAVKLPFNSIKQLRCSSKFWYNLLTHQVFIDLHLCRALEKPPGYLITTHTRRLRKNPCYFVEQSGAELSASKIFEYTFDRYEREQWTHFQSSGGLMCAYSSQPCCFRIFNPNIGEEVQIPRDSKFTRWCFQSFIFSYSPSIKEYKILKLGNLLKEEEGFCWLTVGEVCTLGSNIWREIQCVPESVLCIGPHITQCQGNPFWMEITMETSDLHSFDFVSEKFHVIPGPPVLDLGHVMHDQDKVYFNDSLISMGDTVGYVHINTLWVLKDKTKGLWINRYHFSIPPLCNYPELIGPLENGHLFCLMDHSTKVLVHDMGRTGFRDLELEKYLDADEVEEQERFIPYIAPHVRSFVSPVRIMKMDKFIHKRKWVLDKLKLDCDATEVDLISKMFEFLQAYEKDDKD